MKQDFRIQLTLKDIGDESTRWTRLKIILKALLRQHQYRCIDHRQVAEPPQAATETHTKPDTATAARK